MTGAPDPLCFTSQVWCIDLEASRSALLAIEDETPRLSIEDRARASRFADQEHGRDWVASHVALRLALERVVGASVRLTSFSRGATGRPSLPGASVDFSFSHAAGHALIAVSPRMPVGIDLEGPRLVRLRGDRRAAIEAAGASLSGAMLPVDPDRRFLQAWVRLEALAKAEGRGIARVLSQAGAYGPRRGLGLHDELLPAGLAVRDLALGQDLLGAVALPASDAGPRVAFMPTDMDGLRRFPLANPDQR